MTLVALATSDIPQAPLETFCHQVSAAGIDAEVSESRILLRSAEPPSWIQLFADSSWWVKGLGAFATLYVAELVKEAAKTTWQARAKAAHLATRTANNALGRFSKAILRLRAECPERTKLVLGLPVPEDYFGAQFELVGREEELLAAEIALFLRHLSALQSLLDREALPGGVLGAVTIRLRDNGDLYVAWLNKEFQLHEHVLALE